MIKKGDFVKVDYEGRFESGEIFDSSKKHEGHLHLLEFIVGNGEVIPGFDESVVGMEKDQEKEITIPAEKAYGPYKEEMIKEVPRESLPKDHEPKEGMILLLSTPDGRQFPAKIVEVNTEHVKIDLNHPLAGKSLIFKIKIVEVEAK